MWTFPYRKSYYLTHPWKWWHDFYWSIRNFIHRGRYGFAYSDVWNWYWWWATAGAEALRYLAKHHKGYPAYKPWETPEKWTEYLNDLADKLDWCVEANELGYHEDLNPFEAARKAVLARCTVHGKDENGYYFTRLETTPEDEDVLNMWRSMEEDLTQEDIKKTAEIFTEIGRNLGRFWD